MGGRGVMVFLSHVKWAWLSSWSVTAPFAMDPDEYHGLWRSVTEGQAWSLSHWSSWPVELGHWSCLVHTSQLLVWGVSGCTELMSNPQAAQLSLWLAEGSDRLLQELVRESAWKLTKATLATLHSSLRNSAGVFQRKKSTYSVSPLVIK